MGKVLKKETVEGVNVYDAAIKRFEYLYDNFDKVIISFSGGKDSTVCLNLALEVAKKKNRLPIDVVFFDEEAIHPETIEYVERVANNPDVNFKWYCVPVQHRNACSRKQPYWNCWDKKEEHKWVRPLPSKAITELYGYGYVGNKYVKVNFKDVPTIPEFAPMMFDAADGKIAMVRGIRADESLRRYRSVANKVELNWLNGPVYSYWSDTHKEWQHGSGKGQIYMCSPIYDWVTFDVWTAPRLFGWDYNKSYDIMSMAGVSFSDQRVCPPYGEEPLGGLWIYAQCWPHMWHKMINRVHGAATAGRYANTELYGFGKLQIPQGMTWREWTYALLELYPKDLKGKVALNISLLIEQHKIKTNRPIHETEPDLITGLSWKFLAMIANRGDLKDRRKGQVGVQANNARNKAGVSMEDIEEMDYGTRY
jgi:predicted phosphoadenosine phosphosulfate sulfurtransferase